MSEISLPEALRDVEPVQSIRTPIRMEYTYTPGVAAQAVQVNPSGNQKRH